MRTAILAFVAAALLAAGSPITAPPSVAARQAPAEAGSYTPDKPDTPTLAGSTVSWVCMSGVPWITYSIMLNDPKGVVTTTAAHLVLSDGAQSVTVGLGSLTDGAVSGSVLWPGARADAGDGAGWPGWEYTDGRWRETDGDFAWTRGEITATLALDRQPIADPQLPVPLSYPPASSGCASPPQQGSITASGLVATGGDLGPAVGLGAAGVALVAVGGALLLRRRKS